MSTRTFREKVTLVQFDLTAQVTNQIGGKDAGAPLSFTPVVTFVLRAGDGNAASIKWGTGGSATDPLAAGETIAMDIPAGYFTDLSELCISGTKNDVIHVVGAVIQSLPPNEA